jgi:hypothetical protein
MSSFTGIDDATTASAATATNSGDIATMQIDIAGLALTAGGNTGAIASNASGIVNLGVLGAVTTGNVAALDVRTTATESATSANASGIVNLGVLGAVTTANVAALDVRTTATESATSANAASVVSLNSQVNALPTITATNLLIDLKNNTQDIAHAATYATITQNALKSDQSTTYTKTEVDSAIAAGGGSGGGYTDAQIDGLVGGITSGTTSFSALNLNSGEWEVDHDATSLKINSKTGSVLVPVLSIEDAGSNVLDAYGATFTGRVNCNGVTASNTSYVTGGLGLAVSNSGNLAVGNMGLGMGSKVGNVACHELEVKNAAGVQVAQLESTGVLSGLALNVSSDAVVGGNLSSANMTSSGYILGTSWLSVSGIPSSPVVNTIYCANLNASSHVLCGSVIQSAPPAGTVLKQSMVTCNFGTWTIAPGSTTTVFTYNYTPVSSSSDLHVLLAGQKATVGGSGSDGSFTLQLHIGVTHAGHAYHTFTGDRSQSPLSYPMLAKYVNTGTGAISFQIKGSAAQNSATDDALVLSGAPNTFMQVTEVAR